MAAIEENVVVSEAHHNPHLAGHQVAGHPVASHQVSGHQVAGHQVAVPNNFTPEEESFFTTEAFPHPRPFQVFIF